MMRILRTPWEYAKGTIGGAARHNIPRLSAALAFYAILSLTPLIVMVVTVVGLFFTGQNVEQRVEQEIQQLVGEQAAVFAGRLISSAHEPASNLIGFIASLVFVIFGASRVFAHLHAVLQEIWETTGGGIKTTIKNRLVGSAMVLAAGLAFWLSIAAQTALASAGAFLGQWWAHFEPLLRSADWLLAFTFSVGIISLMYRYLPRTDVPWPSALAGAVLTSVLILAGRFLFDLYLRFGAGRSLPGAAGSLVVLVLWIYYISQIVFVGAEFSRVHKERMDGRRAAGAA